MDLLIVGCRLERLNALSEHLSEAHGITVRVIQADLSRPEDTQRVCEEVSAAPLDMLVNNAGQGQVMPSAAG